MDRIIQTVNNGELVITSLFDLKMTREDIQAELPCYIKFIIFANGDIVFYNNRFMSEDQAISSAQMMFNAGDSTKTICVVTAARQIVSSFDLK